MKYNPNLQPAVSFANFIVCIHLSPAIELVNSIKNSSFENSCISGATIFKWNIIGIYNNGSIITVDNGCNFRRLFSGIMSVGNPPFSQTYTTINDNNFFDCLAGVWNNAADFLIVRHNSFVLPQNWGRGASGIFVQSTDDYIIGDHNTFTLSTANNFASGKQHNYNAGVTLWGTGFVSGKIFCNDFTGLKNNVYSKLDNRTCLVTSNTFHSVLINDMWAETAIVGGVQQPGGFYQYQQQTPTRSAGNSFYNHANIKNIRLDANVSSMTYYYDGVANGNSNSHYPNIVTQGLVSRKSHQNAGTCTMVDEGGGGGDGGGGGGFAYDRTADSLPFFGLKQVYFWYNKADSFAQGGVDSTEVGSWGLCRIYGDHYLASVVRLWSLKYINGRDTLYKDSISNLLDNYNHFAAKYLLLTHKYRMGDTASARNIVNQLASDSANNYNIVSLCDVWKWTLDARSHQFASMWIDSNLTHIKDIAANASIARGMAQGILTNHYSYEDTVNGYFIYKYAMDTMLAELFDSSYYDTTSSSTTFTIACSPNPFNGSLGLTINNTVCNARTITILVTDIYGNIASQETATINAAINCGTEYHVNGVLTRSINASAWYNGYYFALVKENGITQCYKLVLKEW